jgi:hypothetical protein
VKQNCTTNPSLKALNDDCHDAILGLFACCIRYEGPPGTALGAPLGERSCLAGLAAGCTNHKSSHTTRVTHNTPHTTHHRVLRRICSLVSSATHTARNGFSPTCAFYL